MYVTTQMPLGCSRCPLTTTAVPTAGSGTATPGVTHKGRALTSLGGTLTAPLHALHVWTKANLKAIRRARRATPEPGAGTTAPP
jgi:hypothetical protein